MPNAYGTGNFTIASPNSNTDRTLTLPDATGTINTSGAVNEVPAGTASAPSIFPTGDTNTGIFFSAADTIDFTEGGTAVGQFDSSANFKFNSGYGSVATAYGCRAWVNFNGTGTVAIRASGNVTSITDNGTGDYTVNFTNAMPDANYCAVMTSDFAQSIMKSAADWGASGTNPTTTAVRMFTRSGGSVASDCNFGYVAIFR